MSCVSPVKHPALQRLMRKEETTMPEQTGTGNPDATPANSQPPVSAAATPFVEDDEPDESEATQRYVIDPSQAGNRLDKALAMAAVAAGIAGLSRSRFQALLQDGRVRDGSGRTVTDASLRVKAGQFFDVTLPDAEPAAPVPQDIPLDVIYEDQDLLVLNKPAGMVVHPAAGNADGTLVNALLAHCGNSLSGIGGVKRPGIVHRLDKDTSGLMVVAKNDRAHGGLSEQFADRSLSRTYRALVWGAPTPTQGRIDGNIGRSPHDRKKMAVVEHGGKSAATRYQVIESYGVAAALIECKLETGRTHQIRVHLTHIGHPLIGDQLYGKARSTRPGGKLASQLGEEAHIALTSFPRQALHAAEITFRHPISGDRLTFTADPPDDMVELLEKLGPLA